MPDYEKMIKIHHRELWEEWNQEEEEVGGNEICSKCGGDVGHLINCPDGLAFSGDRKTIINNPLDKKDKDGGIKK